MQCFILGYPKNREQTFTEITRYTNLQDAGNSCIAFCSIHAPSELLAKIKLTDLKTVGFLPDMSEADFY